MTGEQAPKRGFSGFLRQNGARIAFVTGLVAVAAIVAAMLFSHRGGGNGWPEGPLTAGIPAWEGALRSVDQSQDYTAVFMEDVRPEDVEAYLQELEAGGLRFISEQAGFPRTAQLDDRYVTVLYEPGTKRLSVTVARREPDAG